ncbi:DUF3800 domain-containing protein [Xylocopilactobacillus apis]|uniref:DUF3800 domain-containing protein n=1 Tax=Xylocopilactobacillus apis TaxID=2932183 RepID=A0AAU9CNK1_9LACO|nr:DUF3800 domain-containing protein [Xylocopilactobacillus apis]BDR55522.1 hypothetical protein KIMC2_00840 [Xylocopilactobacillus apis]
MNIYVYSDESGVFDKNHNEFFVYGGIVIFTTKNHEDWKRKYKKAEQTIRKIEKLDKDTEVKATNISNKSKNKLFRSLNKIEKFGGIIYQPKVLDNIFENKKSKQRYLDYIFKICVNANLKIL